MNSSGKSEKGKNENRGNAAAQGFFGASQKPSVQEDDAKDNGANNGNEKLHIVLKNGDKLSYPQKGAMDGQPQEIVVSCNGKNEIEMFNGMSFSGDDKVVLPALTFNI